MIREYRIKTNIGVGFGILSQIIGFLVSYYVHIGIVLWCAAILIYGGFLLLIWGLWNYAKGKGYKGVWGLLGLLSIFGFVVLVLFPDKKKSEE
ncbi:MAG: hypothetical protein PHR22_01835 [Candidatus Omnitrophica bacterium]|nr:hypothetical protein [Candidatus Omnitrophota bacterium]